MRPGRMPGHHGHPVRRDPRPQVPCRPCCCGRWSVEACWAVRPVLKNKGRRSSLLTKNVGRKAFPPGVFLFSTLFFLNPLCSSLHAASSSATPASIRSGPTPPKGLSRLSYYFPHRRCPGDPQATRPRAMEIYVTISISKLKLYHFCAPLFLESLLFEFQTFKQYPQIIIF